MISPLIKSQDETIFDAVRQGFAFVSENAHHVKIREDLIPAYAMKLKKLKPDQIYDLDHHYLGAQEDTLSYVLTSESANYGSGYVPDLVEEGWELIDGSIYFTTSTRLKKYYEQRNPLTAHDLAVMDVAHCASIFALDINLPHSRFLAETYASSMSNLGEIIVSQYNGRFTNFVERAGGSASTMVLQLAEMGHYNDKHFYRGQMIPFYKRSQHTAVVIDIELRRLEKPAFHDIDALTMFADNAVPHVLRVDGLLEYAPALAAKIEKGEEIPSGSEEEIEIRACAGHVVELLAAEKNFLAKDIDFILWHKSVEDPRHNETPSHRTCSQFY